MEDYSGNTPDLSAHILDRLNYESALRQALERKELHLHYQPQVDLRSGRIVGMEALLRWQNSSLGNISPVVFIPIAEATGLIGPIGNWVLREACRQRRHWLDAGFENFTVSINVSGVQLADSELPDQVEAALREAGLNPSYLEIELTESVSVQEPERVAQIMQRFKTLGVRLAVDDFGTGYSNLSRIKRLAFDKIKIDRAFISDITNSSDDLILTSTVIGMARDLRMQVVAEGVETEAQCALLRSLGCDQIQGYFFSRPQSAEQIGELLQRNLAEPLNIAAADSGGRSLLILDDEPSVTSALRRALRHQGYDIHVANNVEQAFDILATHEIGVILCDQRMPDLSGTEFLSRVKNMYPRSVRIILSGYGDRTTLTESINQGEIYKFIA